MRDIFSTPDDMFMRGQVNDNFELLKAWGGSTLAYAIFATVSAVGTRGLASSLLVQNLFIAAIVCGLAFVLHELAHRIVARGYGAEAHFIANNGWLVLSILLAFASIFIAAPGAVWHRGYLTDRQSGLIALAGPVTNLVISVIFFLVLAAIIVWGLPAPFWLQSLCYIGFSFNAWLGLFNMIPAGPFDGAKVLAWSPLYFGITVAVGILLAFGLQNETVLSTLLQAARAVVGA